MKNFFFLFTVILVHLLCINSIAAQMADGFGAGQLPHEKISGAGSMGSSALSNVNLFNGTFNTGYSLGTVSTSDGLSFNAQLSYSSTMEHGSELPLIKGIPYGEGWSLSIPSISVSNENLAKFDPIDYECIYNTSPLNPSYGGPPTFPCTMVFYDEDNQDHCQDGLEEGKVYWYAPRISIPGVISERFIFKDMRNDGGYEFVPHKFQRKVVAVLYKGTDSEDPHWVVELDGGTEYEFKEVMFSHRQASNQRMGTDCIDRKDIKKNVLLPKTEYSSWYCTEIRHTNKIGKINFTYNRYGCFDMSPQTTQTNSGNIGSYFYEGGSAPHNLPTACRDIYISEIASSIERLDFDYEVKTDDLDHPFVNFPNGQPLEDIDLLYNKYEVSRWRPDGVSGSQNLDDWNMFNNIKSDNLPGLPFCRAERTTPPLNPYSYIGSNPARMYRSKAPSDIEGVKFGEFTSGGSPGDHTAGFLESPVLSNSTLLPGELYEIKFNVKSDGLYGLFDINLAYGLPPNSYEDAFTDLANGYKSIPTGCYQKFSYHSVFNTFQLGLKWQNAPNTGGSETQLANYFTAPSNLNMANLRIQIGPANADMDYTSHLSESSPQEPEVSPAYIFPGQPTEATCGGSGFCDGTLKSGDRIPNTFGIGLPWYMLQDKPGNNNAFYNIDEDRWWKNKEFCGGYSSDPWPHKPSYISPNTRLKEVQLNRIVKMPMILKRVKKYKRNAGGDQLLYTNELDHSIKSYSPNPGVFQARLAILLNKITKVGNDDATIGHEFIFDYSPAAELDVVVEPIVLTRNVGWYMTYLSTGLGKTYIIKYQGDLIADNTDGAFEDEGFLVVNHYSYPSPGDGRIGDYSDGHGFNPYVCQGDPRSEIYRALSTTIHQVVDYVEINDGQNTYFLNYDFLDVDRVTSEDFPSMSSNMLWDLRKNTSTGFQKVSVYGPNADNGTDGFKTSYEHYTDHAKFGLLEKTIIYDKTQNPDPVKTDQYIYSSAVSYQANSTDKVEFGKKNMYYELPRFFDSYFFDNQGDYLNAYFIRLDTKTETYHEPEGDHSSTTNYTYYESDPEAPSYALLKEVNLPLGRQIAYQYAGEFTETELIARHMQGAQLQTLVNAGSGGGSKTSYGIHQSGLYLPTYTEIFDDNQGWIHDVSFLEYYDDGFIKRLNRRGYSIDEEFTWTLGKVELQEWGSRKLDYNYNWQTDHLLSSFTDIDMQVTGYTYDPLQRLKTSTQRNGKITDTYTYKVGSVTGENSVFMDKEIASTSYNFDELIRFDSEQRMISETKMNYAASTSDYTTAQKHDALGRIVSESDPANGASMVYDYDISPLNRLDNEHHGNWPEKVRYLYGTNVQAIAGHPANSLFKTIRINEDGNEVEAYTDNLNHKVATIDGLDALTTYSYDDRDNILSISGPAGIYSYTYDGLGRMQTKTVPNGGVYTYDYYDNDLPKTTTDPKGQTTTNSYTSYGELEYVYEGYSTSGTVINSFEYGDGPGDVGKMTKSSVYKSKGGQSARNFVYDAYGRVIHEEAFTGYLSAIYDHQEIDNADFVKLTKRSGGSSDVEYINNYDHGGRLRTSSATWNNTLINTRNEYNDNDWRTVLNLGGIVASKPLQKVNYGYNERGWLTNINSIQKIQDRQSTNVLPPIDEDDLVEILINLETGYDLIDLINCNPTNLLLKMDGVVNILDGENKGSYPFNKEKSLPLYGGKANTNYSTRYEYEIQGLPDYLDVRDYIKADLLRETGLVPDPVVECQECSFESRPGPKIKTLNTLVIDGVNVLNEDYYYYLELASDRALIKKETESWLLNHGGNGLEVVTVEEPVVPNGSYVIRIDQANLSHSYDYTNGGKGEQKSFFTSPLGAEQACELTCDYNLSFSSNSNCISTYELFNIKVGSALEAYHDDHLNFSEADDRANIRAVIIKLLGELGYYYQTVNVRQDGIDVLGTNAPMDFIHIICPKTLGHEFTHVAFSRSCNPLCDAGLLCWIEQVLPNLIRDFFDTEIFEDFTPTCLEPDADPNTCLDCVLCPEQCDLFAEEIYYEQIDANLNTTPHFAGNISHVKWMTSYGGSPQSYTYTYDANDRLLTAISGRYGASQPGFNDHEWRITGFYDVGLGYDGAGNILSITRQGVTRRNVNGYLDFGEIDDLAFSYDPLQPNQLSGITETTSAFHLDKGFKPYGGTMPSQGVITYDNNGNMLQNNYRGIDEDIVYDLYNNPKEINFDGQAKIEMDYDANGNKLWMRVTDADGNVEDYAYLDGMVVNGAVESLYADGGRIANAAGDYRSEYVISDHLGSGRVWFSDLNGDNRIRCDHSEVLQEENYYPFGMAMEGIWQNDPDDPDPLGIPAPSAENDRFTYNSKEIENELTGWLDYGARWYDPSMGRFMNQDVMAEEFPAWSPYNYVFNNPNKFIDPDGNAPILPPKNFDVQNYTRFSWRYSNSRRDNIVVLYYSRTQEISYRKGGANGYFFRESISQIDRVAVDLSKRRIVGHDQKFINQTTSSIRGTHIHETPNSTGWIQPGSLVSNSSPYIDQMPSELREISNVVAQEGIDGLYEPILSNSNANKYRALFGAAAFLSKDRRFAAATTIGGVLGAFGLDIKDTNKMVLDSDSRNGNERDYDNFQSLKGSLFDTSQKK